MQLLWIGAVFLALFAPAPVSVWLCHVWATRLRPRYQFHQGFRPRGQLAEPDTVLYS